MDDVNKLPKTPGSLIRSGDYLYFRRYGGEWVGCDDYGIRHDDDFLRFDFEVVFDAALPVEEPTKIGAVVVNDNNEVFVRIGKDDMPWWDCRASCDERWSRIVEPKVLFEGVE